MSMIIGTAVLVMAMCRARGLTWDYCKWAGAMAGVGAAMVLRAMLGRS